MMNTIASEFAKQCIHDNKLLSVDSIEFFGQGFDNTVFLVNKKYIFRFPKTAEAARLLGDENQILPHLRPLLPLQIPNILFFGKPTQHYPYLFHGYEMMQGVSAYQVDLSEDDLKKCLHMLAKFLVKLHSIKAVDAKNLGVKSQLYDRTTVQAVIASLQKRMQLVQKKNIIHLDKDFIENQINRSRDIFFSHDHDCLVHGDLDFRHLLLTNKNLTSIIDWSDIGIGHPVVDFVIIHQMFPVSMHKIFFHEYGVVAQDIWLYARLLALHRSLTLLLCGYDMQDERLLESAKKSYARLRDETVNLNCFIA